MINTIISSIINIIHSMNSKYSGHFIRHNSITHHYLIEQKNDLRYIPKLPEHNSNKIKDIYTHLFQIIINKTLNYSLISEINPNLYNWDNPTS